MYGKNSILRSVLVENIKSDGGYTKHDSPEGSRRVEVLVKYLLLQMRCIELVEMTGFNTSITACFDKKRKLVERNEYVNTFKINRTDE